MIRVVVLLVVGALAGCPRDNEPSLDHPDAPAPGDGDDGAMVDIDAPPSTSDVVLVGAGDIAGGGPGKQITADLIKAIPDAAVFTIGDNAYNDGSTGDFQGNFEPSWGAFKSRIKFPVAGNHDYTTANASAYFGYFGTTAGDPSKGYYSADYGAWHVVVINSNCSAVGGCNTGSPQELWLRADLAAHSNRCTVALWHHPLWNVGQHGAANEMWPITKTLFEGGADVILTGHDHNYQRWTPMTHNGVPDAANGLRAFVVGTGGIGFYNFASEDPHVDVRNNQTFGVLKLTLHAESYDWEFIAQQGATFHDSGTGECH